MHISGLAERSPVSWGFALSKIMIPRINSSSLLYLSFLRLQLAQIVSTVLNRWDEVSFFCGVLQKCILVQMWFNHKPQTPKSRLDTSWKNQIIGVLTTIKNCELKTLEDTQRWPPSRKAAGIPEVIDCRTAKRDCSKGQFSEKKNISNWQLEGEFCILGSSKNWTGEVAQWLLFWRALTTLL